MKVEMVRELDGFSGEAVLVKSESERYFVVSSIEAAFDTGQPETLVFEADENGETSFHDIAGGTGVSRDEAIAELEGVLEGGPRSPRPGFLGALVDAFGTTGDEAESALD